MRIDRKELKIVEDEVYDNISIEELVEGIAFSAMPVAHHLSKVLGIELPENNPRFIILSYEVYNARCL